MDIAPCLQGFECSAAMKRQTLDWTGSPCCCISRCTPLPLAAWANLEGLGLFNLSIRWACEDLLSRATLFEAGEMPCKGVWGSPTATSIPWSVNSCTTEDGLVVPLEFCRRCRRVRER